MRSIVAALPLVLVFGLGTASGQAVNSEQQACPPASPPASASATTGAATNTGTDGTGRPENQAVERSAILPNAGGHEQSAAPTVQQDGQSVVARTDCPKTPNQTKTN